MSSTLSILVSSSPIQFIHNSPKISKKINTRISCNFTILDTTGTATFQKGQPVVVNDSVLGVLFSGYVNKPLATNLYPNPHRLLTVDCLDQVWLADKRASNTIYTNQQAGVIMCDQAQTILSQEGVTGAYALDYNHYETDWAAGGASLTNVVATTNAGDGNVGDGDLELSPAGTLLTYTDTFSTGTLTNVAVVNGALELAGMQGIQLLGTAVQTNPNPYVYYQIWSGSTGIVASDKLQYDVWISSTSPQQEAGVDFTCTDGTTLRDNTDNIVDQNGIAPHPDNDLSGFATDAWYTRYFDLTPLAGKTIASVQVALEGNNNGAYAAYFRNVLQLNSSGGTKVGFFTTSLQSNQLVSDNAYSDISLIQCTVYDMSGSRLAPAISLTGLNIPKTSVIDWTAPAIVSSIPPIGGAPVAPSKNSKLPTVAIQTSIDNGATWQTCTNYGQIPSLVAGMSMSGRTLLVQQVFTMIGTDPTLTPTLTGLTLSIQPSYNATKTDVIQTETTNADWNAGTLAQLMATGGDLSLNEQAQNWNDGPLSGQTVFGSNGPFQELQAGTIYVACNAGVTSDVRSRLDFAGQWQNFICEIDLNIGATIAGTHIGMVYRTTGWSNTENTFAYKVWYNPGAKQLNLGYGSNGGGDSYTSLAQVGLTLSSGAGHRMRMVINGTSHMIYMDNVLIINVTDSTYNFAGYLGLAYYNNAADGKAHGGGWDNFGVCQALTGTWTSVAQSLSAAGTYGNSVIQWQEVPDPTNTTALVVQTSINGGVTYQTCTNGGTIPGLTAGASLSGVSLLVQLLFTTQNPEYTPIVTGLTAWVIGQFNATGTWISPALPLTNVGRLGSSLANWNAVLPNADTTLVVKTSVDGGATYQTVPAAGDAIANLTPTPTPWQDFFATNTSADYTQSELSGGGAASWTWDTANSQLKATQTTGIDGILKYLALSSADMAVWGDFNRSDSGGLVARQVDSSHAYFLSIADASASLNANTVKLCKITGSGGGTTPLTVYGSDVAATTLTTAGLLATTTGGTTVGVHTTVGKKNGYGQVYALGTTGVWAALGSIGAPDGNGWLLDSSVLALQQFVTGNWTPVLSLVSSTAALTADIYVRAYAYDTSAHTYTAIGSMLMSGQTISASATYTFSPTSLAAFTFNATQRLYIDCWLNILTNANTGTTATMATHLSSSGTAGVATNTEVDTPGYTTPGSGGVTVLATASINFIRGTYRRFILDCQGSTISASMDGVQLVSVTDSSITAAGTAAILCGVNNGDQIVCTGFQVAPYGQQTSGISVLTKLILASTDPLNTPQVLDSATWCGGTSIGPGALIASAQYQETYVSTNIDDLNRQSNYWWTIASAGATPKALSFQPEYATPAPFIAAQANQTVVLAGQTLGDILVEGLQVEYSGDLYRNQMVLKNVQAAQTFVQKFTGDGTTTSWSLDYPVAPGTIPFLTLNGVTGLLLSIGIKGQDTGKQYYYTPGGTAIDQDPSQQVLTGLQTLQVAYAGTFTTTVTRNNTGGFPGTVSQSQYAAIDGTSGIVTVIEDMSSSASTATMDVPAAEAYGDSQLQRFGVIGRTVTMKSYRAGMQPGQQLSVFIPAHNMVNAQTLITQVDTEVQADSGGYPLYKYTVIASEGPALADWAKVFASVFGSAA